MIKIVVTIALACASMHAQVAVESPSTAAEPANSIVRWKRNILPIVPTVGAQAATIHVVRSLANMQFSSGASATLTDSSYTGGSNEVVSLGVGRSTRTSALIRQFWNSAMQNVEDEIAQTTTVPHTMVTPQFRRRPLILPNVTFAEGVSALYGAEYRYDFWRPVAAIRAVGMDKNSGTVPNPHWVAEVGNPRADPSYPGAYALIGPFHFHGGLTTLFRRIL